jgi:hypothetical protein
LTGSCCSSAEAGTICWGGTFPSFLRHRDEVPRGWRGLILDDDLKAVLRTLRRAYEAVIYRTAQLQPQCHILVHGYDYPFPRDKGAEFFWGSISVAGPWMYPVMAQQKGITDLDTRYKIAKELVDRFNVMLRTLASEHDRFHYVNLRGMLPSVRQWRDEIHPRSAGSRRMALEFRAVMDRITD